MDSTFSVGRKSDFRSYSRFAPTDGKGDPRSTEFPRMQYSPPYTHTRSHTYYRLPGTGTERCSVYNPGDDSK